MVLYFLYNNLYTYGNYLKKGNKVERKKIEKMNQFGV
jgi:hypothetical protein